MTKKMVVTGLVICALLMITGCTTQRVWVYKADPYVKTEPLVNKSVAVTPLADSRANINQNRLLLMFIPLMPYGWMDLNTPEGEQSHINSGIWLFKPTEDIAKAIAEEIDNAGIFKQAFFTTRASEGELNLRGNLQSTYYYGKLFSYGLSIFGPDLWFLGLPAGTCKNTLEISLELVESSTGHILWSGQYKKDYREVFGTYDVSADFYYDRLLKEIMKEVIPSLQKNFSPEKSLQEQTKQQEEPKK
jgi:hypothetical protein